MNLQLSLLVLGGLVILAIYLYSRWQEKKRQSGHAKRSPKSGRRERRRKDREDRGDSGDSGDNGTINSNSGGSVAPRLERDGPSFGQQINSEDNDSGRFASLDNVRPSIADDYRDYVDADHQGSNSDATAQQPYTTEDGFAQHDDSDVNVVHSASHDVAVNVSDANTETAAAELAQEEDFPTLETIVTENGFKNIADEVEPDADQQYATESATGGDDEPELLTDVVYPAANVADGQQVADDLEALAASADQALEEIEEADARLDNLVTDESESGHDPVAEPLAENVLPVDVIEADAEQLLPESATLVADTGEYTRDVNAETLEAVETFPEESQEEPAADEIEYDVAEPEADFSETRPSLKAFLGSLAPINKIKENIQNQLDSVKQDRERALRGGDSSSKKPAEPAIAVSDAVVDAHTPDDNPLAIDALLEDNAATAPNMDIEQSVASLTDTQDIEQVNEQITAQEQSGALDSISKAPTASPVLPGNPGNPGESMIQPAEGFDKLSQIDYYVKLSGERDVSRDSVLAIYREGAAGIARTHSIYGLKLPEKVWCDLEHQPEEARFGDLVVTIQLVDQGGLVTENDMTRFSSLIMKLSESTGRGFSFMAPIENAHRQAAAIDLFRQRFDSIFVVNIRPLESDMFEGAVIERCARQIGLTADDNQYYARYKPVGKQQVCLYSLANMSDTGEFDLENMRAVRTRGVTFFTRPAINRSPGAVFAEMVDAAKAFASRIKGEVIAPGYEDLSTDDVEAIRRSIEKVASEMESYGINPGSEEATRLFG